MTIQEFINEQKGKGVTLNRLAKVLKVSYPALKAHDQEEAQSVNLKLAKSIYSNFGIVLDGFLELELIEN